MTDLAVLVRATRNAYGALVELYDAHEGDDPTQAEIAAIYGPLTTLYAEHGLDANVAESSVDWHEGGTLVESLEYEIARKDRS